MRLAKKALVRLVGNCLTLVVISVVVFALMNFKAPQDIAMSVLGRDISAEQVQTFIDRHGLDRPLLARYASWATGAVQGDLGASVITGRPVMPDLWRRLQISLILAGCATLLGSIVGIILGVSLAKRAGGKIDFFAVMTLLGLAALPGFIIGIFLYLLFVAFLGWLPSESSFAFSFGGFKDRAIAFIMPVASLALMIIPQVARVTRATMIEALESQYVATAKLRGLSQTQVIWGHAFRASTASLTSVIGINAVFALTGTLVIEVVFGLPGLSTLLVSAIGSGDVVTTQAIIMTFAFAIMIVNMIVDTLTVLLNPRLRFAA